MNEEMQRDPSVLLLGADPPLQTALCTTNKLPVRNDALNDALDEQAAPRAELEQLRANSSLALRLDMGL